MPQFRKCNEQFRFKDGIHFSHALGIIYSWTSPMMKVRYGPDAKRPVYNELYIGTVHEFLYHATQQ